MGPKCKSQVNQDFYYNHDGVMKKNPGYYIVDEERKIKILQCGNCNYVFANLKLFEKHHSYNHGDDVEKKMEDFVGNE